MAVRTVVWHVVFLLVGAVVTYALVPNDPIVYREVVVPAARIIEREVPGEVRFRDRIVNRYIAPVQVATAPGGAEAAVNQFCAPVVVLADDTTGVELPPRKEVIRSVDLGHSLFPLTRDPLLVTSMDNYGDLYARDFKVRPGVDIGSGDSIVVRYPRFAVVKEVGEGLLWYAGFRLLEAGVRSVTGG